MRDREPGAEDVAVELYLRAAFRASLIPAVDNIRSLGIVWIPGIMAGIHTTLTSDATGGTTFHAPDAGSILADAGTAEDAGGADDGGTL